MGDIYTATNYGLPPHKDEDDDKSAIAVNSFADLQRGTVGDPLDGPLPLGQEDLNAVTPGEHDAAAGIPSPEVAREGLEVEE